MAGFGLMSVPNSNLIPLTAGQKKRIANWSNWLAGVSHRQPCPPVRYSPVSWGQTLALFGDIFLNHPQKIEASVPSSLVFKSNRFHCQRIIGNYQTLKQQNHQGYRVLSEI